MTGILAKLENAVTSEEQNSVLRSCVSKLVNSTDDHNNVEVLLQQLIGLASGSNFDYKTKLLFNLEMEIEKFELLYMEGPFKTRKYVIGLLLACAEDGFLPGKELLSFALCRKSQIPARKKSRKKKAKGKGDEMDEYYISAKIAVDCASTLIALILDMFEPGRQDLYISDSNYTQLVTSSFLTLCELAKPTTYFSNKIDGQTIDIKNLTDSFNISVNGLITAALDSEIFDKVVLQKTRLSNSLVDAILKFIDILFQNSNQNFAKLRTAISKSKIVGELFLPHINKLIHVFMYNTGSDTKGILAQKRSAQSSISYSLRTLTSLTFKLKGAKEIIAKSDPISHLLRISQIQKSPYIICSIVKLHVNIEGGHGTNWKNNHNTTVQKIRNVVLENMPCGTSRFQILMDSFYNGLDALPVNHSSRAYHKVNEMFKELQSDLSESSSSGKRGSEKLRESTENKLDATIVQRQPQVQFEQSKTQVPSVPLHNNKDYDLPSSPIVVRSSANSNAPVRFCCMLSGQIMDDPIKHPAHEAHCDRSMLEIYKVKQEMKSKNDQIVLWPKSSGKDVPLEDVDTLETDAELQSEIQVWRMTTILRGKEGSSWPFGDDAVREDASIKK